MVGVVGRGGAAALAHGVLAAAAVTESTAGLFHTQLGTSGPRVVFLHGVFGQGRNWTTIAKALSGQARVSLVDLPNHGRSPWTDHFSYPEMANQVADLLQTEAGGEPYAVVGHSMGGKVAMAVALLHPELVQRLCVVDVSPVPRRVSGFETYVAACARSISTPFPTARAPTPSCSRTSPSRPSGASCCRTCVAITPRGWLAVADESAR